MNVMLKKYKLFNQLPLSHSLIFIFVSIFLFIITCIFFKSYSSFKIVGLIECNDTCFVKTSVLYSNVDVLSKVEKVEYNNKKYDISRVEFLDVYLNNDVPFQDVIIYLSDFKDDVKVGNFKLLYNYERVYKKIYRILIEGV